MLQQPLKDVMKAKATASKRTKDRLKEHPDLTVEKESDKVQSIPNKTCVFLRSSDGWFGWIPKDELDIQD